MPALLRSVVSDRQSASLRSIRGHFSINPPQASSEPPAVMKARATLVLAAVMMAIFVAAIDLSIVATQCPTFADLGGFHLFSWTFAATSRLRR